MKINFPNYNEIMLGADIVFRHKINMNRTSSAEYYFNKEKPFRRIYTLNAQYAE